MYTVRTTDRYPPVHIVHLPATARFASPVALAQAMEDAAGYTGLLQDMFKPGANQSRLRASLRSGQLTQLVSVPVGDVYGYLAHAQT